MKKAELLIKPVPSGDPFLKGTCSICPNVTFVLVGDIAENRQLMQQMFYKHLNEVHGHERQSRRESAKA